MNIKKLLTDDNAVSPVIGVILMVAITVILAAVIAAFVLGLGDTSDPAPQVSFDTDYNSSENGNVTFTVRSGNTFDAENVDVVNQDNTDGEQNLVSDGTYASGDTIGAGDSFTVGTVDSTKTVESVDNVDVNVGGVGAGERVDLIFTPDDGGDSSIIGTFTAPE